MFGLFKSKKYADTADRLYRSIIEQARLPIFYSGYGVPDTVDGRFDMIVLHAHILFDRLKDGDAADEELSQAVFDLMFADMDQNLREMGVGDIGVAKRIKAMAEAFYGRATAYAVALKKEGDTDLTAALKRNVYRKSEPSEQQLNAATTYFRTQIAHVGAQNLMGFQKGDVSFKPPGVVASSS